MTTELIGSLSIEGLLAARDNAVRAFETARALLLDAREHLLRFDVPMPALNACYSAGVSRTLLDDAERWEECGRADIVREIDRHAWAMLFKKTHVRQLMDVSARRKMDALLHSSIFGQRPQGETLPPLTAETIAATLEGLHANRAAFFEDQVESVFKRISWDHKTNRPCQFGARMIVRASDSWYYGSEHELYDLERVLCLLDGQPPPDNDGGLRSLARRDTTQGEWHTVPSSGRALLAIKIHSETAHVKILAPELVDQLNRIMSNRYPQALGRRTA